MRFISTLTGIGRSDIEKFGMRACDLSVLKDKGFNIPLTFVINQEAFDEFVTENGLIAKMNKIVAEKAVPSEAYAEIVGLFVKSSLPKDFLTELSESYESLSIEQGAASASSLIREYDFPFVTLVRSPSYLLHQEDHEGIVDNVKGLEQLELGIKLVWSTMFSPDSRIYREKNEISEKFGKCIIVQKMRKPVYSAQAYSRTDFNEFLVRVKSFKGMQDYAEPILGKDIHDVDSNSLLIRNASINIQEFEVTRDFETEELVTRQILSAKQEQKLNEKIISECARMAKRAKSCIGKDVKIYLSITDTSISLLHVNRMTIDASKQVEQPSEIIIEDGILQENEMTEIDKVTVRQIQAKQDSLAMPQLISGDEAKQLVESELSHKVFTLDGFEEEKIPEKLSEEVKLEIEVYETDSSPEEILGIQEPEPIGEDNDMIGEVMLAKEIVEKMEQHASNNNKEGYDLEGRKLRALLSRLKQN